jgi:hypothetical protein
MDEKKLSLETGKKILNLAIPNQSNPQKRDLSPAVRELADVLAFIAVQQLFEKSTPTQEGDSNETHQPGKN